MKKKLLLITQEISPYIPGKEISFIFETLPKFAKNNNCDMRIFMPCFGYINERKNQLHEVIRLSRMNISINEIEQPLIIKVASYQDIRVQIYFIDNEDLFGRKFINHDHKNTFFSDNDERVFFFCKGVLETVKKMSWIPDIIHTHGWMSAVIPAMIKKIYKDDPVFEPSKIIFSAYSDLFKGQLGQELAKKFNGTKLKSHEKELIENPDYYNLYKLGVAFSDGIIVGSKDINYEIIKIILETKKPILPYKEDINIAENYLKFYDQILNLNSN